MCSIRDDRLEEYLDSFLSNEPSVDRVKCCGSSRSLYCPECCRLLIPKTKWPSCLQEGKLTLPFNLHIVLHDKRTSATGLHAVALFGNRDPKCVTLMDVERGDTVANYYDSANTYLLFPSVDSVPLSSIQRTDISTLVVLDCKWTRSSMKDHPYVADLPKVHLTSPPEKSQFWRWHNEGPGMLSTIEAIYLAAVEVAPEDNETLIHLMWLFAMQRAAIGKRGLWKDRKGLPFSDHGKEEQRAMRRQTKKDKVETRDNK